MTRRKKPDFEIRVRTYRESDSEKVQELFKNAIIIGCGYNSGLVPVTSHWLMVDSNLI